MAKTRFLKSKVKKILQKYEDGVPIQEIIKEYGISQATFYNWKARYGNSSPGLEKEIDKLREENERLKQLFVDLSLENISLKTKLNKNNIKSTN